MSENFSKYFGRTNGLLIMLQLIPSGIVFDMFDVCTYSNDAIAASCFFKADVAIEAIEINGAIRAITWNFENSEMFTLCEF